MLVKIRGDGAEAQAERDALDEMLACHERIRRFAHIAGKLAGAAASEVVEGAQVVHRYFSVALPLHAADEDHSFAPRLTATAPAPDVAAAVDEMIHEHVLIEAALADMVPVWAELMADPARQAALAARLDAGAARIAALFATHLEKEERVLFPAAKASFTPEMLAGLRDEMRGRRAT
jgi:hypothetical protein